MWGEDGIKAKHDEMCKVSGISDKLDEYCNKIRAARAMAILTAVFGLFSAVLLFVSFCKARMWMLCTAITCVVLVIAHACCGLALGINLADDNTLIDEPREGFFGICGAALLSVLALILASIGLCVGPKGGSSKPNRRFAGAPIGGYSGYGNRRLPVGHAQGNPQGYPQGYPQGHPQGYPQGYPHGNPQRSSAPGSLMPPPSSWPAAGGAQGYGQMPPSPVGSPRPPTSQPAPASYGHAGAAAPPAGYGAQPGYSLQVGYSQPSSGHAQHPSPRAGDFGIQPIRHASMPPLPKSLDYY